MNYQEEKLFYCPNHPEELITNYCCIRSCHTPLCPDCINDHTRAHKQKKEYPEIDTLSRVKKMCKTKLLYILKVLEKDLHKLEKAENLDVEEILYKSLQDLEKLKFKLIEKVEDYFLKIKEEFQIKFQSSTRKTGNFNEMKTKIRNVGEELKNLHENLYEDRMFESIKNTSNLDSKQLIDFFDKMVIKSIQEKVKVPTQFIFSDEKFRGFESFLTKIVGIEVVDRQLVIEAVSEEKEKDDFGEFNELDSYFKEKFITHK